MPVVWSTTSRHAWHDRVDLLRPGPVRANHPRLTLTRPPVVWMLLIRTPEGTRLDDPTAPLPRRSVMAFALPHRGRSWNVPIDRTGVPLAGSVRPKLPNCSQAAQKSKTVSVKRWQEPGLDPEVTWLTRHLPLVLRR